MLVDGKYKIIKVLGRGGTGCVFLAENIRINNYWAIKEVYKGGVAGMTMREGKLIAESRILTKLRHPGLPAIVDVINTYESYLIVMEYIEGISMDKLLERNGVQSEQDVRRWGAQLCDVLQYLHSQQPPIIYRDMKPANIMLKPDRDVVLVDFGMAREFKHYNSHDTNHLGTHGYAAPEQYDSNCQSDARTDIYGLGMTLYQLVTGQDPCVPPYGMQSIRNYNPSVSVRLELILHKCTEINPENRYQTAQELKRSLEWHNYSDTAFDGEVEKKTGSKVWMAVVIPLAIVILIVMVVLILPKTDDYADSYNNTNSLDALIDVWLMPWTEQEVWIDEPEQIEELEFTPEISGMYSFYAWTDAGAPAVWLYDEDYNEITNDNLRGEYSDFYISCWLEEGETYYLQTTLYYLDPELPSTGSYTIFAEMEKEKKK